jgi:hypothetical protein
MWFVAEATAYQMVDGKRVQTKWVSESNHLDLVILDLLERFQAEMERQDLASVGPFTGAMWLAVCLTSTFCSSKAVTRDTEAALTLQKIQRSLAASLLAGDFLPVPGSQGSTRGSSQN